MLALAAGADTAFEIGADLANGKKEVFLPWKGFNKNPRPRFLNLTHSDIDDRRDRPTRRAIDLAAQFHPLGCLLLRPEYRLRTILKLMTRNSYQVLTHTVGRLDVVDQNLFCDFATDCPFWGRNDSLLTAEDWQAP